MCFGIFNAHKKIICEFLSEFFLTCESHERKSTQESCLENAFEQFQSAKILQDETFEPFTRWKKVFCEDWVVAVGESLIFDNFSFRAKFM